MLDGGWGEHNIKYKKDKWLIPKSEGKMVMGGSSETTGRLPEKAPAVATRFTNT